MIQILHYIKTSTVNIVHNTEWRNYILTKMPLVESKKMAPQFAVFGERFARN